MIDNHSSKRNINLVIGLGKSGFWAAKYLRSINKRVIVWESKDGIEFLERKTELEELNILVSLNKEFVFEEIQPFVKEIESVVVSPSIPYDHITIIELKKKGIKVIGEINVAWEILKDTNWIGITGTNGKTTVTHLLSHILCDSGLYAPFAGNIGTPLCKYAHSKKHEKIDWVVAELSSYQIEISPEVKPNIGIWTTFTEDHLERHKTLQNYVDAKFKLLDSQSKSCLAFVKRDDVLISRKLKTKKFNCKIVKVNTKKNYNDFLEIKNKYFLTESNRENLSFIIELAKKLKLKNHLLEKTIKNFKGLKYRQQIILQKKNLTIINDSKSTSFSSSVGMFKKASNILWLLGGIYKKGDKLELKKKDLSNVTAFIYGENKNFFNKQLRSKVKFKNYINLEDAVKNVFSIIKKKGSVKYTILFSPCAASFDRFKNFEERGLYFNRLVKRFMYGK